MCNDCRKHSDPTQTPSPDYDDSSVFLGMDDAREVAPSNWITDVRPPVFRNALGGPNEAPAPAGMNQSIMPIFEARSFDLSPWYPDIMTADQQTRTPDYMDEAALYLDEGYIGGQVQELG